MSVTQIGELNPKRKRKAKRKTTKKRKTTRKRRAAPKRRTTSRRTSARRNPTPTRRRRRTPSGTRLNPVGGDIMKTAKDTALITIGALAAYIGADYLSKKVAYIDEHANVAKPAIMAAGGLVFPEMFKGKNKAYATKAGYGMLTAGALYLAMPWLMDQFPGLAVQATPTTTLPMAPATAGYYRTGRDRALGAYARDPRYTGRGMGRYTGRGMGDYYGPGMPSPRRVGMGAISTGGGFM